MTRAKSVGPEGPPTIAALWR
ncbi:DUF6053 domain-containing protein [Lysobacter enzymogenes]